MIYPCTCGSLSNLRLLSIPTIFLALLLQGCYEMSTSTPRWESSSRRAVVCAKPGSHTTIPWTRCANTGSAGILAAMPWVLLDKTSVNRNRSGLDRNLSLGSGRGRSRCAAGLRDWARTVAIARWMNRGGHTVETNEQTLAFNTNY